MFETVEQHRQVKRALLPRQPYTVIRVNDTALLQDRVATYKTKTQNCN